MVSWVHIYYFYIFHLLILAICCWQLGPCVLVLLMLGLVLLDLSKVIASYLVLVPIQSCCTTLMFHIHLKKWLICSFCSLWNSCLKGCWSAYAICLRRAWYTLFPSLTCSVNSLWKQSMLGETFLDPLFKLSVSLVHASLLAFCSGPSRK